MAVVNLIQQSNVENPSHNMPVWDRSFMICRYTKTRGGAVAFTTCKLLRNSPLLACDLTALPLFLTTSTASKSLTLRPQEPLWHSYRSESQDGLMAGSKAMLKLTMLQPHPSPLQVLRQRYCHRVAIAIDNGQKKKKACVPKRSNCGLQQTAYP
jgi:hypothetical protein